jgi:hypothetical protein
MLWAFAAATLMGFVFGLFLRVPAVLAASVMLVASCIALMPIAHWSLLPTVAFTFGMLAAFQYGYLGGVWARRLSPRLNHRSHAECPIAGRPNVRQT